MVALTPFYLPSAAAAEIASTTGGQDEAVALNTEAAEVLRLALAHPDETGAATSDVAVMLMEDISCRATTTVRALESRAFALRDGANSFRTGAKTDDAFDKAQALFTEALSLFKELPASSRQVFLP